MAETISEKTGIQLSLVVLIGASILGGALAFFEMRAQVLALAPIVESFPQMKLDLSHIKRDVKEIRSEENGSQAWKRRHMMHWCSDAERMNDGFSCPDPFEDVP